MAYKLTITNGMRFGRLVTTGRTEKREPRNTTYAEVVCDCGAAPFYAMATLLKSGGVRSCGCLRNEMAAENRRRLCTKHGQSSSLLYKVWNAMKQRCFNPNDKAFHDYSARGITVCLEWKASFEHFQLWALGAGYRRGLTIERRDVNGNYEPENCTWIPKPEQSSNTRRCIMVAFGGESHHLKEWSRVFDIPYGRVLGRIRRGWTPQRALELETRNEVAFAAAVRRKTGKPVYVAAKRSVAS